MDAESKGLSCVLDPKSAIATAGRTSAIYSKSSDLGNLNIETQAPRIFSTTGKSQRLDQKIDVKTRSKDDMRPNTDDSREMYNNDLVPTYKSHMYLFLSMYIFVLFLPGAWEAWKETRQEVKWFLRTNHI